MNGQTLLEQEVILQIAMSIGTQLELDAMLGDCLPVFVRGLGCHTAAILLQDKECGFFTPRMILPQAALRNRHLHQAMAELIDMRIAGQTLPVLLPVQEGRGCFYGWQLGENGLLLLGRSREFSYPLYCEIHSLADKLAFAICACEQYRALQQAERIADRARMDAEHADQAKGYFLTTMGQELRGPLQAVQQLCQQLNDSGLTSAQQGLVQGIVEGNAAILQLVNDVLDFSGIAPGKQEWVAAPFVLPELLHGMVEFYSAQAAARGLRFEYSLSPAVPRCVVGQPVRLRQILHNLLSNAIKFTEQGFVALRIEPSSTQADHLQFSVTDSGIGIADPQLGHLLEAETPSEGRADAMRQNGLGLSLVSRLVAALQGRFGVTSRPGEGSCFWCTLPLPAEGGDAVTTVADPAVPAVVTQTGGRVLLVEDSPTNQLLAVSLLQKAGCEVEIAANGVAAVQAATQQLFDLILMDLVMPDMDGFEATTQIRALAGAQGQVPIIAMTAHSQIQDRARCLAAGMNDYLVKPIRPDNLHEMLVRWRPQTTVSTPALPVAPSVPPLTVPILDFERFATLQQETSPAVLMRILEVFALETRQRQQQLLQAVAAEDMAAVAAELHTIKSSAGALGGQALSALAGALEQSCRQQHWPQASVWPDQFAPLVDQTLSALRQAQSTVMSATPDISG